MSASCEDLATDQPGDVLVSYRKKVSIVWRYFEKLDRWRVRCNICRHEQNYQGTTGNILRHLKNKHGIDATVKAQQTNPGLLENMPVTTEDSYRTGEEDYGNNAPMKNEHLNVSTARKQMKSNRASSVNGVEQADPYTDSTFQLYSYTDEQTCKNTTQNTDDKQKHSPEEERLLAEIEYFREKAGYYKMQKNLVAIQAKKIKYELDHL